MTTPVVEDAVDVKDLAKRLNCSTDKVYRMTRAREIPYFRVGREYRYHPSQVIARLSGQPAPWKQSKRSTSRRRAT